MVAEWSRAGRDPGPWRAHPQLRRRPRRLCFQYGLEHPLPWEGSPATWRGRTRRMTQRGEWGPWVNRRPKLARSSTASTSALEIPLRQPRPGGVGARPQQHLRLELPGPDTNSALPDSPTSADSALAIVLAGPGRQPRRPSRRHHLPRRPLRPALAQKTSRKPTSSCQIATKGSEPGRRRVRLALCLSRAMLLCAPALHAHDRRWLVDGKKAGYASAGKFPSAPTDFERRVCGPGREPDQCLTGRAGHHPWMVAPRIVVDKMEPSTNGLTHLRRCVRLRPGGA